MRADGKYHEGPNQERRAPQLGPSAEVSVKPTSGALDSAKPMSPPPWRRAKLQADLNPNAHYSLSLLDRKLVRERDALMRPSGIEHALTHNMVFKHDLRQVIDRAAAR